MIGYLLLILIAIILSYYYLGNYIYFIFTSKKDLKVERLLYKICKLNASVSHSWKRYTFLILYISGFSIFFLYLLQRFQGRLPYSHHYKSVDSYTAINTAISFATNTNWQSYIPEQTIGTFVTSIGLIVQQFISPAIGIIVAIFLSSSIASTANNRIVRNFYQDTTRTIFRLLLPYSFVLSLILVLCGTINTFKGDMSFHNLITGTNFHIQTGPVAALESIKNIGTNGGGFYNANSAHPFENPSLLTNTLQIIAFLSIPVALIRTYGKFVGRNKHANSLAIVVCVIAFISIILTTYLESKGYHSLKSSLEGKEVRFGNFWSAIYGSFTTLTANGGVNSSHDSFLPLSGLFFLFNMLLGEIAPGGAGSGLYGLIILAILTSFLFGLMIGKLPSYCQKKIGKIEITIISLYMLITPLLFPLFICLSLATQKLSQITTNPGSHGFTEILYAYASMTGNNGSSFAGFISSNKIMEMYGSFAMFFSRYLPIVLVMALAGSLNKKDIKKDETGVLPIYGLTFSLNLAITIVVIVAISYLPFLILGPVIDLIN